MADILQTGGNVAALGALAAGQPEIAAVIKGLEQVESIFKELGNTLVDFVSKSNPGLFAQFTLAVNNLQAAFGKLVEPIVEAMIPAIDLLNSVITELQPAFAGMMAGLRDIINIWIEFVYALAPVVSSLNLLIPLMEAFTWVLEKWAGVIKTLVAIVELLTGATGGTKSKTVAATQSGFVGVEDIGKQFREAALNQGGGMGENIAKMRDDIDAIKQTIIKWYQSVSNVVEGARERVDNAVNFAASPGRWIYNQIF